jgi:hypothetical protein
MATGKHYRLKSAGNGCEVVVKRGKSGTGWEYPNPIGNVCKTAKGYVYHDFPIIHVERGPEKTKTAAIRKVIKAYATWIGQSSFAGAASRRKRRR